MQKYVVCKNVKHKANMGETVACFMVYGQDQLVLGLKLQDSWVLAT